MQLEGYEQIVDYILSIPKFAKKLGTENLLELLEVFGHPERAFPVIHVAGTNGKGSTCAFLQAIYMQAGYRVGMFTSPHLVSINERIRINDSIISDDDFVEVFHAVHDTIIAKKLMYPSFFEFMFIMAAVYFQKMQVDLVIYETGMGGRLDATNVLQSDISVITSVGLDHTQFLGDSLAKIAAEKAGIIKPHTPVVAFFRDEESAEIIRRQATIMEAPLYSVEKSNYMIDKITTKNIDFSIDCEYYKCDAVRIMKTGLYQVENAVLAMLAASCMPGIKVTEEDVKKGLLAMKWDGRMEEVLPGVLLDGAHNEEAVLCWCNTVASLYNNKRKRLLFAVANDKDYVDMIAHICSFRYEGIYITAIPGTRRTACDIVGEQFRKYSNDNIMLIEDTETAFRKACGDRKEDELLFLVGSLYLAGAVKAIIEKEQ